MSFFDIFRSATDPKLVQAVAQKVEQVEEEVTRATRSANIFVDKALLERVSSVQKNITTLKSPEKADLLGRIDKAQNKLDEKNLRFISFVLDPILNPVKLMEKRVDLEANRPVHAYTEDFGVFSEVDVFSEVQEPTQAELEQAEREKAKQLDAKRIQYLMAMKPDESRKSLLEIESYANSNIVNPVIKAKAKSNIQAAYAEIDRVESAQKPTGEWVGKLMEIEDQISEIEGYDSNQYIELHKQLQRLESEIPRIAYPEVVAALSRQLNAARDSLHNSLEMNLTSIEAAIQSAVQKFKMQNKDYPQAWLSAQDRLLVSLDKLKSDLEKVEPSDKTQGFLERINIAKQELKSQKLDRTFATNHAELSLGFAAYQGDVPGPIAKFCRLSDQLDKLSDIVKDDPKFQGDLLALRDLRTKSKTELDNLETAIAQAKNGVVQEDQCSHWLTTLDDFEKQLESIPHSETAKGLIPRIHDAQKTVTSLLISKLVGQEAINANPDQAKATLEKVKVFAARYMKDPAENTAFQLRIEAADKAIGKIKEFEGRVIRDLTLVEKEVGNSRLSSLFGQLRKIEGKLELVSPPTADALRGRIKVARTSMLESIEKSLSGIEARLLQENASASEYQAILDSLGVVENRLNVPVGQSAETQAFAQRIGKAKNTTNTLLLDAEIKAEIKSLSEGFASFQVDTDRVAEYCNFSDRLDELSRDPDAIRLYGPDTIRLYGAALEDLRQRRAQTTTELDKIEREIQALQPNEVVFQEADCTQWLESLKRLETSLPDNPQSATVQRMKERISKTREEAKVLLAKAGVHKGLADEIQALTQAFQALKGNEPNYVETLLTLSNHLEELTPKVAGLNKFEESLDDLNKIQGAFAGEFTAYLDAFRDKILAANKDTVTRDEYEGWLAMLNGILDQTGEVAESEKIKPLLEQVAKLQADIQPVLDPIQSRLAIETEIQSLSAEFTALQTADALDLKKYLSLSVRLSALADKVRGHSMGSQRI